MTHFINLTIAHDDFEGKFTCSATPGEPCRLTCPSGCESWDTADHEHELIDAGSCGLIEWIENDECSIWESYDGAPGPLRSGQVDLTYDEECVTWSYPREPEETPALDLGVTLDGAYCPMGCGQTLFVHNEGEQILCENPTCPDYTAVNDILADSDTEHVVTLDAHDFSIKHPLRERVGDELLCPLHREIADLSSPPAPPGRYRVTKDGAVWSYSALAADDPAL